MELYIRRRKGDQTRKYESSDVDRVQLPLSFDADRMQAEVGALNSGGFTEYNVIPLRSPAHLGRCINAGPASGEGLRGWFVDRLAGHPFTSGLSASIERGRYLPPAHRRYAGEIAATGARRARRRAHGSHARIARREVRYSPDDSDPGRRGWSSTRCRSICDGAVPCRRDAASPHARARRSRLAEVVC